jgi:hypothetical protein
MDAEDIEDMLFGLDASQDDLDGAASDISDEYMLDDAEGDEETLWDLENDAVLTPATSDCQMECDDVRNMDDRRLEERKPTQIDVRTLRDR